MKTPKIESVDITIKLGEGKWFRAFELECSSIRERLKQLAPPRHIDMSTIGHYPCLSIYTETINCAVTTLADILRDMYPDSEITIEFCGKLQRGTKQ